MRFSATAVAFAGVSMAAQTIYSTQYHTITSTSEEVIPCTTSTYISSKVYTSSDKVVTSSYVATTTIPVYPTGGNSTKAASSSTKAVGSSSKFVSSAVPYPTSSAAPYPSLSVITISTCVPTVIYSTVTVSPTVYPTGSKTSAKPSVGTGAPGYNTTSGPYPTKPVTAGAASIVGSGVFAAAAAVAAALLA